MALVDDPDFGNYAAYGVGVLGFLLAVGKMGYDKFFSTEGKANDELVNQLSARIGAQEDRMTALEAGLDAERDARRKAEDKVHALELDNMLLRAELSRHGITLPPRTIV